jgi:hypothetical protein
MIGKINCAHSLNFANGRKSGVPAYLQPHCESAAPTLLFDKLGSTSKERRGVEYSSASGLIGFLVELNSKRQSVQSRVPVI